MSVIDSLVALVSPAAAAKRAAWRNVYNEIRHYDAGSYGRLNAAWVTQNDSAENTDGYSRDVVRARARDLERNSDVMNAILGAFKRNTVGRGFQLQAKTGTATVNKAIEDLWRRWCKARNCDVTGQQSLSQIMRMAVVRKKVDGGVLFIKRYTRDGIVPFSLQMVEVDELDGMATTPKGKGNKILNGIEYSQYNRPMGYWIRTYQLDGMTPADPQYIDAKDVIFYFTKKRPSQVREMSDMAQTLTRIRDCNEFITAVSVKQRIEACLSVFIKKALPVSGVGRPATSMERRMDYEGKSLTPGMIRELNAGDDVTVVNPTGQGVDAAQVVKLMQRLIGAGQGLSYEAMSRDMSETNYSSARQGAIEDELTFVEEQEALIAVLDEIYETFVISCVLSGAVSLPDFWEKKDQYLEHEWIVQPKKWIDPQKEATATKTALNTGVKTFKQVSAENGTDWRAQIDDIVEVLQYGKAQGVDLGGVFFDGKLQSEAEEESPDGSDGGPAADEPDGDAPAGGDDGDSVGKPDESDGGGTGQEQ